MDALKLKFFGTTHVILHSRDIRKCQGAFKILFELKVKEEFYRDLDTLMTASDYRLFVSGIDKAKHREKYGKAAEDPYSLSLSFIMERLIFYLDNFDKRGQVRVIVEKRSNRQDKLLLTQFNSIMSIGTHFVKPTRLQKKIGDCDFYDKHDNITGLQVADLCAYPMARHYLYPQEPYPPFDIVEKKLYCDDKGQYLGWGFKVFP